MYKQLCRDVVIQMQYAEATKRRTSSETRNCQTILLVHSTIELNFTGEVDTISNDAHRNKHTSATTDQNDCIVDIDTLPDLLKRSSEAIILRFLRLFPTLIHFHVSPRFTFYSIWKLTNESAKHSDVRSFPRLPPGHCSIMAFEHFKWDGTIKMLQNEFINFVFLFHSFFVSTTFQFSFSLSTTFYLHSCSFARTKMVGFAKQNSIVEQKKSNGRK